MILMSDLKEPPIPAESSDNTQATDITLVHDSIHKHININRLVKSTGKTIKSECTATIEQFENKMINMKLKTNGLLVVHVGTNDIRQGKNANEAAKSYENTIQRVTRKGHKVIVSLLTAVKRRDLDKDISIFNEKLYAILRTNDKVTFCDNRNIKNGQCYEQDGIHINKHEGTSKLAGNLKYSLYTVLDIKKPNEKKRRVYNYHDYDDYDFVVDEMTDIVTAAIRAATQGRGQRYPRRRYEYWN